MHCVCGPSPQHGSDGDGGGWALTQLRAGLPSRLRCQRQSGEPVPPLPCPAQQRGLRIPDFLEKLHVSRSGASCVLRVHTCMHTSGLHRLALRFAGQGCGHEACPPNGGIA